MSRRRAKVVGARMTTNSRMLQVGAPVALLWFAVDQATKAWALHSLADARGIAVTGFLNIVLVHNTGVTFGMFSAAPPWLLLSVMLAMVAMLAVWMSRAPTRTSAVALGLVVGGALGNIADRMRHGAVTDFLDLHMGTWHWPAFNAADVGIVCGVAVLLLGSGARTPPARLPGTAA